MLYALCNDRTTPAFQAGLSPSSPIICAFCALGNRMLLGKIKGIGRDLLVGARLTLIDKPDGGSRSIRIECWTYLCLDPHRLYLLGVEA